jgi:GntR family transcriptional regulator
VTKKSVSQQLHSDLEAIISSTDPGDRLLTEPDLAKQLGVSRATLREAMRTFEIQGMIRRKQGSGTYVTHPTHEIESGLEVLESIETMAERIGLEVALGSWNVEKRTASEEERESLDLNPGEEILDVSRVILAEGRPVAYLIDILLPDILSAEDFDTDFSGSVLDMLIKRGSPKLVVARTEINAVTATSKVARALGIQRGVGLLCFCADLFDSDGKVVDQEFSYFLPGYFNFHVVRRVM